MSIVSLVFNLYEIVVFSASWEYGQYYGKHEGRDYVVGDGNFYRVYSINNAVLITYIMAVAKFLLTFASVVIICIQSFYMIRVAKELQVEKANGPTFEEWVKAKNDEMLERAKENPFANFGLK